MARFHKVIPQLRIGGRVEGVAHDPERSQPLRFPEAEALLDYRKASGDPV